MPDQPAPNHAENDARFTVELASVLTGARRRALRDGDRQIDTAHLLHSLIETDPEVREAFDGGPQLAKVLGYLVQRSIGYGLRWQSSVEDTGAVPVVRAPAVDGWSPSALAAMEDALYRAASRGGVRAHAASIYLPRWPPTPSAVRWRCSPAEAWTHGGWRTGWSCSRPMPRDTGEPLPDG